MMGEIGNHAPSYRLIFNILNPDKFLINYLNPFNPLFFTPINYLNPLSLATFFLHLFLTHRHFFTPDIFRKAHAIFSISTSFWTKGVQVSTITLSLRHPRYWYHARVNICKRKNTRTCDRKSVLTDTIYMCMHIILL